MTDTLPYPKPGESFEDSEGRGLLVEEVVPGDGLGREVRGLLTHPGEVVSEHYATDQRIWHAVWLERQPRAVFKS